MPDRGFYLTDYVEYADLLSGGHVEDPPRRICYGSGRPFPDAGGFELCLILGSENDAVGNVIDVDEVTDHPAVTVHLDPTWIGDPS